MDLVFSNYGTLDDLMIKRFLLLANHVTILDRPIVKYIDKNRTELLAREESNDKYLLDLANDGPVSFTYESLINNHNIPSSSFMDVDIWNDSVFLDIVIEQILIGREFPYSLSHALRIGNLTEDEFILFLRKNRQKIPSAFNSYGFPAKGDFNSQLLWYFRITVLEIAVGLNATILIAGSRNLTPTSNSNYFNQVLTHELTKLGSGRDQGGIILEESIIESVLPDEALKRLSISELNRFRIRTIPLFEAWNIEVQKINTLFKEKQEIESIQSFISTHINPEIFRIKRELEKIRDEMFANILSAVKSTTFAAITSGTISTINFEAALISFIVANFKTPKIADEMIKSIFKKRNISRDSGYTYLLKIKNDLNKGI